MSCYLATALLGTQTHWIKSVKAVSVFQQWRFQLAGYTMGSYTPWTTFPLTCITLPTILILVILCSHCFMKTLFIFHSAGKNHGSCSSYDAPRPFTIQCKYIFNGGCCSLLFLAEFELIQTKVLSSSESLEWIFFPLSIERFPSMCSNKRVGSRLNQRVEIKLGFRTKAHEKKKWTDHLYSRLTDNCFPFSGLFSFPAIVFQSV